jgi:hypothetical protein
MHTVTGPGVAGDRVLLLDLVVGVGVLCALLLAAWGGAAPLASDCLKGEAAAEWFAVGAGAHGTGWTVCVSVCWDPPTHQTHTHTLAHPPTPTPLSTPYPQTPAEAPIAMHAPISVCGWCVPPRTQASLCAHILVVMPLCCGCALRRFAPHGRYLLVAVTACVWNADNGALFAGRLLPGTPPLAPVRAALPGLQWPWLSEEGGAEYAAAPRARGGLPTLLGTCRSGRRAAESP